MKISFRTEKADRIFVISATLIFGLSLAVTTLDFVYLQGAFYNFNMVSVAGLLLFSIGIVLRIAGRITLGKYYSYGLRTLPDQKLVKHGIYKHIRHPITLAASLYSTGIPLTFSSLYGFVLMLVLIPLFLYRIRIEEKMLVERFGEEYLDYIKKTKRLIPFIY